MLSRREVLYGGLGAIGLGMMPGRLARTIATPAGPPVRP